MTFGVQFNTAAGLRQIDGQYPVPEYLGKVQVDTLDDQFDTLDGYTAYYYSALTPPPDAPSPAHTRFVFLSLPDTGGADVWYTSRDPYLFANTNGIRTGVVVYRPIGSSVGASLPLPEAYIFSLGPAQRSSQRYGMLIYNDAGVLVFDSSQIHLSLQQVANGLGFPDTGISTTLTAPQPAKPALFIPTFRRGRRTANIAEDSSLRENWTGIMRRNGGYLQGKQTYDAADEYTEFRPHPPDSTYGPQRTGYIVPIFDCALYD